MSYSVRDQAASFHRKLMMSPTNMASKHHKPMPAIEIDRFQSNRIHAAMVPKGITTASKVTHPGSWLLGFLSSGG